MIFWEQTTSYRGLKNLQFSQKILCEVRVKKGIVSENITAIKRGHTEGWRDDSKN